MSTVEVLARMGMLSKGFVYALVGGIALKVAFLSGQTEGKTGALRTLAQQPFGKIMLSALTLGFLGYALWRLSQAFFNTNGEGDHVKGWFRRLTYFIRGVLYGSLTLGTGRIVLGAADKETAVKSWSRTLMEQPFGSVLVATLGATIIGVGIYQFHKVYSEKYQKDLNFSALSEEVRTLFCKIAPAGIISRGAVFCVMGYFLMYAAWRNRPSEARGFGEALQYLAQQSYGKWVLASVACGLIIYAAYELFKARYLRID